MKVSILLIIVLTLDNLTATPNKIEVEQKKV